MVLDSTNPIIEVKDVMIYVIPLKPYLPLTFPSKKVSGSPLSATTVPGNQH